MGRKKIIPPKTDGIFVEVDNGLIISNTDNKSREERFNLLVNGEVKDILNEELYKTMLRLDEAGKKVTILTDKPLSTTNKRLRKFGVDTNRFQIKEKSKYRGCLFTGYVAVVDNSFFLMEDDEKCFYLPIFQMDNGRSLCKTLNNLLEACGVENKTPIKVTEHRQARKFNHITHTR